MQTEQRATPELGVVAHEALATANRLWNATTRLMGQLHVLHVCEQVAVEQQGKELQEAAETSREAAAKDLERMWRDTTAALSDWISASYRLRVALRHATTVEVLSLARIAEVAAPFLAPDGEMNAADVQRFAQALLQEASSAAPPAADDIAQRLRDTADAFECHAATRGIDQIEAAGRLMREAAHALEHSDAPWRDAVICALVASAAHRPGLEDDPVAAVRALLTAALPATDSPPQYSPPYIQ